MVRRNIPPQAAEPACTSLLQKYRDVTEELIFKFHLTFITLNLNGCMWLVATVLDHRAAIAGFTFTSEFPHCEVREMC